MNLEQVDKILRIIVDYAETNSEIYAIGLCGSLAKGSAGPDSDIDLSIIVKDNSAFKRTSWLKEIAFSKIQDEVDYYKDAVYGKVWSRHVFLVSKLEIEFSFADVSWTDTDPIDPGTLKVVSDGYKIIYDPHLILKNLVDKILTL